MDNILDIGEDDKNLYHVYKNSKPYFSKLLSIFILFFYFFEYFFFIDDDEGISVLTKKLYFSVIDRYPLCIDRRLQLWRFMTSSLLHLNMEHLFNNLILFLPISYYFDVFYKFKILIVIILFISFLSNFIFYYYYPYSSIIGCSHLVFGLFGALLSDYFLNLKFNSFFYICKLLVPLLCISIDILNYYFKRNDNNGYIVHWGGFLTGFITGLIFLYDIIDKKYNKKIRVFAFIILFFIISFLLHNYIFNWPPKVNDNCCYLLLSNQTVINC